VLIQESSGVQVGDNNVQNIYHYGAGTWTARLTRRPAGGMPYPGLNAFEEPDHEFFFGRDGAVEQVMKRMSASSNGILVVSGVSGTGKSSLLHAGMLPRLRRDGLSGSPGAETWPCLLFTPGTAPLDELAAQVAVLAGISADDARQSLAADPARFALLARQAVLAQARQPSEQQPRVAPAVRGSRLLLVIDQFEQLFTLCPDEGERRAFITALASAAARAPDSPALVLLGVSAGFEARCAEYPQLTAAIQDRYLLTAMTGRELEIAITEPARRAGARVDRELADHLIREARGSAGVLPLLSYALAETWLARTGDTMTLAGYDRTGGIETAVATAAQRAYDTLTEGRKDTARQVFLQLTATSDSGRGDSGTDTAVPATRAELDAGKDPGDVQAVLDAFAGERLITLTSDGAEISHEVLLTAWPLLRGTWLEETRADRVLRTKLRSAAADRAAHPRDRSYLWSGSLLASALATAGRVTELTPAEREFLTASTAAEEARRAAQDAGRLRERRQNRRLRALAGGLAVALAAAVSAAGYAVDQQHQALAQRDFAASSFYAAQSDGDQTTNLTGADLDALAGWAADETPQARGSLLSREADPYLASFPEPPAAVTRALAISQDGRLLAVGEEPSLTAPGQSSVQLWDMAQQKEVAGFPHLGGYPSTLAFSPDGSTLAAVVTNAKANLRLWDVATHKALPDPIPKQVFISTLAYSPDGRILAVGSVLPGYGPGGRSLPAADDRSAIDLWDLASHRLLRRLTGGIGLVYSLAFSPDGSQLASGGNDHTVRLWNVATGTQQAVLGGSTGPVLSVSFSPDGRFLAGASEGGTIQVWNAPAGSLYVTISSKDFGLAAFGAPPMAFDPQGQYLYTSPGSGEIARFNLDTTALSGPIVRLPLNTTQSLSQMAFSRDGNTLAVGGTLGYPTALDEGARTFYEANDDPLTSVSVNPDGRLTATGDADGTVQLWDTSNPADARVLTANQGAVLHVAFSPGGKLLAAISDTCTTSLWDVATGRLIATLATPSRYLAPSRYPATSDDNIANLSFSPGGKTVATYCSSSDAGVVPETTDDTAMVWETATQRLITAYRVPNGGIAGGLAYSPAGHTLAIDTGTGDVLLWDTVGHRITRVIETGQTPTPGTLAITFSPGGKLLATAGTNGTIKLWDAASGDPADSVDADTQQVHDLAFSPDGSILAAAGQDSVVRLWSVPGLQQVASVSATPQTLSGNSAELAVNEVAFGPGGHTLVSANSDGTAQVWDLNPADAVRDLCGALGPAWVASRWPGLGPGSGHDPCSPG